MFKCFSQYATFTKDTFLIKKEYLDFCSKGMRITMSAGKCYYNNKEITRTEYDKLDRFAGQVCDSLLDKATGKYCKFLNRDSIVVEEGFWYREFFIGTYKSYYSNGIIRSFGQYVDDHKSPKAGEKIGKWIYYNKNGKVKKIIVYKTPAP